MTNPHLRRCRLHIESLEERSLLSLTTAFVLTTENELQTFTVNAPETILSSRPITGLQDGETVLGIDFRPATGQLYGISNANRMLVIDPATGAATQVGTEPFSTPLRGSKFGIDFNPTVDRLRVVSDAGQNLRLHPDTGAVAAVDTDLAYAAGDPYEGVTPNVVAAAYTNNFDGAGATTLYVIDAALGILNTQVPPNDGTLNSGGPLGVDSSNLIGLDIIYSITTFAVLTSSARETPGLYFLDLFSGRATFLGTIGGDRLILDLAVQTPPFGSGGGGGGRGAGDIVPLLIEEEPAGRVIQAVAKPVAAPVTPAADRGADLSIPPVAADVAAPGVTRVADDVTWAALDQMFTAGFDLT